MEKESPKLYTNDDKSYRDSLKTLLNKDNRIKIYGEYNPAEEFIGSMESPFRPDVCFMDIALKKMSSIECTKQMKERFPEITFIIMTAYPDRESFAKSRAIEVDYIEKGICLEYLIDKIITTKEISKAKKQSNATLIRKRALKSLEIINKLEEVKKRVDELLDTQKEVIKLNLEGKSNQEIALILNIGEGTVHTNASKALKKLNSSNFLDFQLDEL